MITSEDLFSLDELRTTMNTLAGLVALREGDSVDGSLEIQALNKVMKLVAKEISIQNL